MDISFGFDTAVFVHMHNELAALVWVGYCAQGGVCGTALAITYAYAESYAVPLSPSSAIYASLKFFFDVTYNKPTLSHIKFCRNEMKSIYYYYNLIYILISYSPAGGECQQVRVCGGQVKCL